MKFIALLLISCNLHALILEDYLPQDVRYDTTIPTPRAVTGLEVGQRHYRHDQVVYYFNVLAASSSRAQLINYGTTTEGRPQILLLISSDKNMENPEALINNPNILRLYQGFSVHGNEASGTNASLLYAYYLLAGHSKKLDEILNQTLIIIDPSLNPDGYDHFVSYVNAMRGMIDTTDINDAAHNEPAPNGRTNHYWFDLNRDWLLLTQIESQNRIKQFHKWQPHVFTDHHETAPHHTFFFQPGIPSRTNPLIPKRNTELTTKLGQFHAQALAAKNVRFFTKESYDDFYPGKGSTYPDLQGAIGILFEQASAKGGTLQTKEGIRKLQTGIDNQFQTAHSTLYGSYQLKSQLLNYKKEFFENAQKQAKQEKFKGYLLDLANDHIKAQKLTTFFALHHIKASLLSSDQTQNNHLFKAKNSLFVPLAQKQYTLIKSLFSTQTNFQDNTFYDVSAWNLPYAWGIPYAKSPSTPKTEEIIWQKAKNSYAKDPIAYAFNWDDGNTAAALNYLLQQEILTKAASKSFSIKYNGKELTFKPGAIIIPAKGKNKDKIFQALSNVREFFHVSIYPLTSELNKKGIDLGSPSITTIKAIKVAMLFGDGINSYQAGSFWHLIDTQIGMPLSKIHKQQLKTINLNPYTHLILPTGNYKTLGEATQDKLSQWIKKGGTLIAFERSAKWVEKNLQTKKPTTPTPDKTTKTKQEAHQPKAAITPKKYGDFEKDLAKNSIGGAIITATADLTHPLAFGTQHNTQYLLVQGNTQLKTAQNPYVTPIYAKQNPLAAGYISSEQLKKISHSPMLIAQREGKGSIIKFGFNPTFRGYWLGTQKWLTNALFFSQLIKKTQLPK